MTEIKFAVDKVHGAFLEVDGVSVTIPPEKVLQIVEAMYEMAKREFKE